MPYVALLKAALTKTLGEPLSAENLTLEHVRFVFFDFSPTRLALWNTLLFAFVSAILGTALALVASYLANRKAVFGHSVVGFLATAPIAVPGIVLGVGMFIAYTRGPARPLRHDVDHDHRLRDDRVARRLSAAEIGILRALRTISRKRLASSARGGCAR